MTEHLELTEKPRDHLLEAAEKELVAFERKEREFRKKLKRERGGFADARNQIRTASHYRAAVTRSPRCSEAEVTRLRKLAIKVAPAEMVKKSAGHEAQYRRKSSVFR